MLEISSALISIITPWPAKENRGFNIYFSNAVGISVSWSTYWVRGMFAWFKKGSKYLLILKK